MLPPTTPKMMVCLWENTQHSHQQTVGTVGCERLAPPGPYLQESGRAHLPTWSPEAQNSSFCGPAMGLVSRLCPGSQRNLIRGLGLIAKHTSLHSGGSRDPYLEKVHKLKPKLFPSTSPSASLP